ncbi:MAG: class I SAM-dependent methyltransferase [Parcubacteria group bacterium]|nr:class I SAM-dependent methyltransferase [Parcubacteria group bacterium]
MIDSSVEKRILDIGCNTGALLSHFVFCGWTYDGFEPSPNMVSIARNRYDLTNVQNTFFTRNVLPDRSVDFITLLHTLEHIEDPSEILEDVSMVLKDGGLLYVEVPNIFAPKSCFYTSYFAAPHIYMFSPNSLKRILEQHGYIVMLEGTLPRGICALARKGVRKSSGKGDDVKSITSLIQGYKKQHDRRAMLYRHVLHTLPVRALIKLRIPIISKLLAKLKEHIRINKVI